MIKRETVKRIWAWLLAFALVFGNSPMAVRAEEMPLEQDKEGSRTFTAKSREGQEGPAMWFDSDRGYLDTYEDGGGNLQIFAGKTWDGGQSRGESVSLQLNTGDLEYQEIRWEIGRWEPDEGEEDSYHIVEDESLWSCVDTENQCVTVDAEDWTDWSEDDSIVVYAYAMAVDEESGERYEVASAHVDIQIRQWYYDFQWPEGDRTLLPGWDIPLSNTFNCYVENAEFPDGDGQEVLIYDIAISQEEEVLSVEDWDDGSGWSIRAENFGQAEVTLYYDPGTSDESGEYTFSVTVAEDYYEIGIDSDTGTNQMLPGAQMTLMSSLVWKTWEEEEEREQDTEGFSVKWEIGEGSDAVAIDTDDQGNSVTVTALENTNDWWVQVIGIMCDGDGGECARAEYWIHISEQYYVLETCTTIDGIEVNTDPDDPAEAPEIGDEIRVTPKLTCFDADSPNGRDMTEDETVRYCWGSWDEAQLRIQDQNGNEITWGNEAEGIEENRTGTGFFTVTKRTNDWTSTWLEAQVSDGEGGYFYVTDCQLIFGEHAYQIWLEDGVREDHFTWVFSDEDLTIRLANDTENEKLTFAWEVGMEENGEIPEPFTQGSDYDITEEGALVLHGAALKDRGLYQSFWIRVSASIDGSEVWQDDLWAEVREPETYFNWNNEDQMLKDDSIFVDKYSTNCYFCNADYPYGEDVSAEITDIKIAGHYNGWDEEENPIETMDTVATLAYSSGGEFWEISGKNYGFVKLEVTYRLLTDEEPEDTLRTEEIFIGVSDDICWLEWDYPEGTDNMLQDSVMRISDIVMRHNYVGEDGEHFYGEECAYDSLTLKYSEHDENLIAAAIGEDGTSVVITSEVGEDNYGGTDVWVNARRKIEGELVDVVGTGIHVNVTDQYYALLVSDICVQPGDEILADDLGMKVLHYSEEYPEGRELDAALDCYFYDIDQSVFSVGEMGFVDIWGGYEAPKNVQIREDVLDDADHLPYVAKIGIDAFSTEETEDGEVQWFEDNYASVVICRHAYESAVTKEPSCEEAGEATYTCKYCGDSYTEKLAAATGHEYDTGKVTKEPSCEEAGIRTYTCAHCKGTYTEKIAPTGHKWSSWKTVAEATVFTAETQTRSCSVCKKTETRTVGSRLAGTISLNASTLVLQVKQKTSALTVSGMASGDYVDSVTAGNTKLLKVTGYTKDGKITLKAAKKTGKTDLTIKLASGVKKTIQVKIQKNTVKTTKISGLTKKLTLKSKKKLTLIPALTPITSQQKVTYTSSNKKVAVVSAKGVLTAKKKGKAKITVKSGSKKVVIRLNVT